MKERGQFLTIKKAESMVESFDNNREGLKQYADKEVIDSLERIHEDMKQALRMFE